METTIDWFITPLNHNGDEIGPEVGITLTVDFDFPSGDITLLHIADADTGRTLRDPQDKTTPGAVMPYERFVWTAALYDVMHDDELRSRIARQCEEDRYESQFEAPAYEAAE